MEGDDTVHSHDVGYDKHADSFSHSPTSQSVCPHSRGGKSVMPYPPGLLACRFHKSRHIARRSFFVRNPIIRAISRSLRDSERIYCQMLRPQHAQAFPAAEVVRFEGRRWAIAKPGQTGRDGITR